MAQRERAPWHLWLVGLAATAWNGFGCFDYVMTKLRDTDYLHKMMPDADPAAMLAWADTFPVWSTAAWALGVWGGLAGSLLLLARSRLAVPALILSLLGTLAVFIYQFTSAAPPPKGAGPGAMPLIIIALAIAEVAYAAQMKKRRVLQ